VTSSVTAVAGRTAEPYDRSVDMPSEARIGLPPFGQSGNDDDYDVLADGPALSCAAGGRRAGAVVRRP
jgi:hypothetical protein